MSEQGMLYQSVNTVEESSLEVKDLARRFITSHSDQDRYNLIKKLVAINTAGLAAIDLLNRYGFSVLETDRVRSIGDISDMDTQTTSIVKRKR
jgi:hypothetical protein